MVTLLFILLTVLGQVPYSIHFYSAFLFCVLLDTSFKLANKHCKPENHFRHGHVFLTSLHYNKVDISVQDYCAWQVQLDGIFLHFKLLRSTLQVTDPVRKGATIKHTFMIQHTNAAIYMYLQYSVLSLPASTHLYTAMWTPLVMSSFNFLTFFSFLCPAVSLRAALASSWALKGGGHN